MATRQEILHKLEEHWDEIGLVSADWRCSARRPGGAGRAQRAGLLVEFEKKSFDVYMDLKSYLEKLFNCRVDLVLPNTIKPRRRS